MHNAIGDHVPDERGCMRRIEGLAILDYARLVV
jgi:hypothetical protein